MLQLQVLAFNEGMGSMVTVYALMVGSGLEPVEDRKHVHKVCSDLPPCKQTILCVGYPAKNIDHFQFMD